MLKFNKLTLEPQWIDTNICFCGGGSDDGAGSDTVDRSNPSEMAAREAAAARSGTVTSGGGDSGQPVSTVTSINADGSRSAVTSGSDFEQAMAQESFTQNDPRAMGKTSNFQAARMEGLMNSEQMALERAARAGKLKGGGAGGLRSFNQAEELALANAGVVLTPEYLADIKYQDPFYSNMQTDPNKISDLAVGEVLRQGDGDFRVSRGLSEEDSLMAKINPDSFVTPYNSDSFGGPTDIYGRSLSGYGLKGKFENRVPQTNPYGDSFTKNVPLANTGISSLAPSTAEEKSLVDTLLGNIEPGSLKADPNYDYQAPKEDFYADAYQDMYGQTAPGTNFYSIGSAIGNSTIPTLGRAIFGGEAPRSGADEAAFQAGQMFNLASRGMTREQESDLYSGKTDMFDAETGKFSDVPVGTRGGTLDTSFLGPPVYSGMYDPYYKGGPFENLVNPSQEMQGGAGDDMSSAVNPPLMGPIQRPPIPGQPPADGGDFNDYGRLSDGRYVIPTEYAYNQNPTILPNPFLRTGQGLGSLFYRNV